MFDVSSLWVPHGGDELATVVQAGTKNFLRSLHVVPSFMLTPPLPPLVSTDQATTICDCYRCNC